MNPLTNIFPRVLTAAVFRPRSTPAMAALVVTALAITSGIRWALNPYLKDELPFFLYLPAVLIVTAVCGPGAGLATLGVSVVLAEYLWTPSTWSRTDLVSALVPLLRFIVTGLLIVVIALLQKSASAQKQLLAELEKKSGQLEEKSTRLETSEKMLATHAETLERLVAERTAKLEETVAELEEFSYTISHDLRSPLRAMQGFAQILREDYGGKLDDEGRDHLKRIDLAAQRLDALIRDVLSYSSLGRAVIELQPVDLEAVVDQVVSRYPVATSARPQIEIARPLLPVLACESCLVQALSNLIENAVKFVDAGALPQVRIWTEQVGSNVRLHVADRGIGIPAAALPHLFQPFRRAHRPNGYEGTGIGLAIVKRATERQGGTVGVSSEVGKGSDFWIELPLSEKKPGELTA
jgi:signal transduction histidine kinase